jgi:hypothetical protein
MSMGGARPGAGRPKGSPNKATAAVRALAQEYGPEAIKELARLAKGAESEAARVSACEKLLDRAYGKSQIGSPIRIELPDTSTAEGVGKAFAAIIQAASSGIIAPSEAKELFGILESQRRAIELVDLEGRIAALERRQANEQTTEPREQAGGELTVGRT